MRVLVDIAHPGHVHLFKNFIWEMENKGHQLFITTREIPPVISLLNSYNFSYNIIGKKYDAIILKGFCQINYDFELIKVFIKEKIDIAIGTSINIAHASKFTKTISIIMDDDDDDVQPLMVKFGHPFANFLLSPDALKGKRKRKDTIYYAGYHELAYLHPNRFTPDLMVLKEAGIKEGEKYFVLRFNSFKAHHDIGARGLSIENKRKLVQKLQSFGKVFITTEREMEPEFEKYRINIPPHKIHSFLAFATMLIGDSQTMTSEAAILGVPAFKCNSFAGILSVPNELEKKYKLCYSYNINDFEKMLLKIEEILLQKDIKNTWNERKMKMLNDKLDVTAFIIDFVENL